MGEVTAQTAFFAVVLAAATGTPAQGAKAFAGYARDARAGGDAAGSLFGPGEPGAEQQAALTRRFGPLDPSLTADLPQIAIDPDHWLAAGTVAREPNGSTQTLFGERVTAREDDGAWEIDRDGRVLLRARPDGRESGSGTPERALLFEGRRHEIDDFLSGWSLAGLTDAPASVSKPLPRMKRAAVLTLADQARRAAISAQLQQPQDDDARARRWLAEAISASVKTAGSH